MGVRLLTEHHLEFLNLKEGCRGLSESTLIKMSNCWKSHAAAHISANIAKRRSPAMPCFDLITKNIDRPR